MWRSPLREHACAALPVQGAVRCGPAGRASRPTGERTRRGGSSCRGRLGVGPHGGGFGVVEAIPRGCETTRCAASSAGRDSLSLSMCPRRGVLTYRARASPTWLLATAVERGVGAGSGGAAGDRMRERAPRHRAGRRAQRRRLGHRAHRLGSHMGTAWECVEYAQRHPPRGSGRRGSGHAT